MASGTGQGLGASGWEQEGDDGVLGFLALGAALGASAAAGSVRAVRRQPMLGAILVASAVGALAGIVLAKRHGSRSPAAQSLGGRSMTMAGVAAAIGRARAMPDLLPLLTRALSNPVVQAYLQRALVNAISRRLSRGG